MWSAMRTVEKRCEIRIVIRSLASRLKCSNTSSMDARAEAEVFEHFRRLASDRITILISHRFSTVRMADHIVVLDQGRIVEQGSHEELMSLGGTYASLFTLQARGYR